MRAYKPKEFDKLLAVADPANDVDFVRVVGPYIIRLIFVICFATSYILYSTMFSLFSCKWVLEF